MKFKLSQVMIFIGLAAAWTAAAKLYAIQEYEFWKGMTNPHSMFRCWAEGYVVTMMLAFAVGLGIAGLIGVTALVDWCMRGCPLEVETPAESDNNETA